MPWEMGLAALILGKQRYLPMPSIDLPIELVPEVPVPAGRRAQQPSGSLEQSGGPPKATAEKEVLPIKRRKIIGHDHITFHELFPMTWWPPMAGNLGDVTYPGA